jgi:ABC-2 type transport system permease protein
MLGTVRSFVRLRWRLLRGSIRHGGTERVGALLSTVASVVAGLGIGAAVMIAARGTDQREELAVVFCTLVLLAVVGFGVVAGISQPIDPRVIAAEPLSDRDRAVGLLAATASGPPGLAGISIGTGLAIGMMRDIADAPVVILAVGSWLASMLLVARTATNLLAMLTSRFPRAGQLLVGLVGLAFYGAFQFVPALLGRLDDGDRTRLAAELARTPPGQLGRALGGGGHRWLHLFVGSIWIPLLALVFIWSNRELSLSVRRAGGLDTADAERSIVGRLARRACGGGAEGAIAWRGILTRFRSPRTALETVTGAGIGLAAVLVPALVRDGAGSGAVLVGGAIQLAVLFMSGNSFGNDGPALTHELLSGISPRTLVRGKARSIAIVAAPLALIGPVVAAAVTGEWRYIAAGFGVGLGGLLAGAGAAVVQSTVVPIAIPDSDNPFAGGESGKGIVAAVLLGGVLIGLAILTVPVALALIWASDRGRVPLVTIFGLVTIVVGWAILRAGEHIATRRLVGREPEFLSAVTPAR